VIFLVRNRGNFMPRGAPAIFARIDEKHRSDTFLAPCPAILGLADSAALSPYLAVPLVGENVAAHH
jgi:hypothetical protein